MNLFFIEFRDPLFGLIVFFALIFVITFLSYWWGKYKNESDSKDLAKFLKQFQSPPSHDELQVLISKNEVSEKPWLLLADAYATNGNYEKSIEIYNEILKFCKLENYRDTMFLLGQTYFKAGFLERAKQIFLEILKHNPRTPQVLNALLLVYEYMRDYDSALEVLEPLEELDKNITLDSIYLKVLYILSETKFDENLKIEKLLDIYKINHQLTHMIFEYIFRINPKLAWQNFDKSKCDTLVDILWLVDKKNLDLDIITQTSYLRELYTARGDIKLANSSDIFDFNVLINLKDNVDVTLSFEYMCSNCKQTHPFVFTRCSNCNAIDSFRIELSLTKNYARDFSQLNNSFQ